MAGQGFVSYLQKRRPLVESWLRDHAWTSDEQARTAADLDCYLYAPLAHYHMGGGKRVRPILALLGCEAVGGAPECALATGCAIELFQSAALIHDDIADGGELRRGEPCLHLAQGVGMAINTGDAALVQVTDTILTDEHLDPAKQLAVLRLMVDMERRTLEGQALDLGWVRDNRWDLIAADYLAMASLKTSYYSAATPLMAGAVCGGADAHTVDELGKLGKSAGLAFQIQDDLLNLVGDAATQGKDFRSDITEGKRTLVMVHALETLPPSDRAELARILNAGTTSKDELDHAVSMVYACGSIDYAQECARKLADDAKQTLANLDIMKDARDLLASMTDFFVERRS